MGQDFIVSRRQLLGMSMVAGGAFLLTPADSASAQQAGRTPTSEQAMGPFYPVTKPADRDADLTVIKGKSGRAKGKVLYVMGRVMDMEGRPLPGAEIEIWQANTFGRYTHPGDKNPAPLDPNFEGYGRLVTDLKGRYRFKTIMPAPYPASADWVRPPHIHFQITTKTSRLVTQMYFAGQPLNDKDGLFRTAANQETLITKLTAPTKDLEQDALVATWDIVLPRT